MAADDKALQISTIGARKQFARIGDLSILEVGAGISSSSAGLSVSAVTGNPVTVNPTFDAVDFVVNGDTGVGLHLESSTDFLGVGTGSPATRLDMDGALSVRGLPSAPGLAPAGQGRIYFDTLLSTFRVSENNSAYVSLPTGTGAAGQVAFWTGAGTTSGENQFFWDSVNNRLGINTASPQSSFEVASGQIASASGSLGAPGLSFSTDLATGLRLAAPGDLRSAVSGTDRIIADGSGVHLVGPTSMISAGVGSTLNVRLFNDGAALNEKSWTLFQDAGTANTLRLRTEDDAFGSPVEIASFTRTGDVGIGIAVPTAKLDVRGGAVIDVTTFAVDAVNDRIGLGTLAPANILDVVTTAGDSGILVSGAHAAKTLQFNANDSGTSQVAFNNSAGAAHFALVNTTGALGVQSALAITDAAAGTERISISLTETVINENAGGLDTRIEGASNTHLIFADASTDFVGIGESVPAARLHVTDDTDARPVIVLDKSVAATGKQPFLELRTDSYTDTEANLIVWTTGGGTTKVGAFGMEYDQTNNVQDFVWRDQFDTAVTALETMRLTGSGDLGIGVSNPSTVLDISGALTQRGISPPALSAAGQGVIHFDSSLNKFRVSENNGAFVDLLGGGGGGAIGGGGTAGQIAYFTSASDIASESALSWDGTNDRLGVNEPAPVSTLEVTGSLGLSIESVALSMTLNETHYSVLADAALSSVTLTLPVASTVGKREYRIKKIDNSVSNIISITPSGGDTIDGAATYTLNVQYESVTLVSNGANWYIF